MQGRQASRPRRAGAIGPAPCPWRSAIPRSHRASGACRSHVTDGQPAPGEELPTSRTARAEEQQQRALPPPHAAAPGTAAGVEGHPKPQQSSLLHALWAQLGALWPGLAGAPREASHLAAAALASALLLSAAAALQAPPPALAAAAAAAREASSAAVVVDRHSSGGGGGGGFSYSGGPAAVRISGSSSGPVLLALGPQVPGAGSGGRAGGGQQQQQAQQRQSMGWRFDASSEMEDGLLEAARQVTARIDSAFDVLSSGLEGDAEPAEGVQQAAETLINEVWGVVDASYMDARQAGFDRSKWTALRDKALARKYRDMGSAHRAVRDMIARGLPDPYCRWVPPGQFAAMKKYDVTGVGLNLGTAEEYVKKTGRDLPGRRAASDGDVWVVGISKGSAADSAGLEQGDQLVRIGPARTEGLSPFQASSLISGQDEAEGQSGGEGGGGGSVQLAVRKASGRVEEFSVPRPSVQLASPVQYSLQRRAGGRAVGVVAVKSFTARAQRDVAAAVAELQVRGASELELDLRDNRGGLVTEGLEVARLFLGGGAPIVLTESKAMASAPPTAEGAPLTALPLTVLVNDHTASASEILAGALKDNCRAVLVGGRTYGKGLIQSVYELSDSSGLVITVGKYLTPGGVDIDRFGIEPNFKSQPPRGAAEEALSACRLQRDAAGGLIGGGGGGGARGPQELLLTGEGARGGGGGRAAR